MERALSHRQELPGLHQRSTHLSVGDLSLGGPGRHVRRAAARRPGPDPRGRVLRACDADHGQGQGVPGLAGRGGEAGRCGGQRRAPQFRAARAPPAAAARAVRVPPLHQAARLRRRLRDGEPDPVRPAPGQQHLFPDHQHHVPALHRRAGAPQPDRHPGRLPEPRGRARRARAARGVGAERGLRAGGRDPALHRRASAPRAAVVRADGFQRGDARLHALLHRGGLPQAWQAREGRIRARVGAPAAQARIEAGGRVAAADAVRRRLLRRAVRLPVRQGVRAAAAVLRVAQQAGRGGAGHQRARRESGTPWDGAPARMAPDLPRRSPDGERAAAAAVWHPALPRRHRREPVRGILGAGRRLRVAIATTMTRNPPSPYQQELSDFRLNYSKAGSITSLALVLLGVGLDISLYPAYIREFLVVRGVVALLTLAIFALLYTPAGRARVRSLTLLWLALPQVMIAWMIALTDGAQSIYFVGLHLALYAAGIILPITFVEGMGFGLFTYLVYALACVLHPGGIADWSGFIGRSLFIVFSAVASAVCTYFNERARIRLFRLQRKVAETNATLVSTNQALAQIKGHMIQQEKMAALGTLSAGLMHEVNNPVNYSLMALNMAMLDPAVSQSPDLKESLGDAKEGLERVQHIVSDLKTFAYQKPGGEDNDRIFLLEKAVQAARRLTGHELSGIDVQVRWPQDTHVRGDEPAVIGVLINLFSNAALGLGLSVSYAVIQRHGGTLRVASEPGAWTEFSFDLGLPDSAAV